MAVQVNTFNLAAALRGRPTGIMCVTNKHIYFHGGIKSFRIRHEKIVSIDPSEDGVTIQIDATAAKPQVFITNDGWFTQNLLSNVAQL